MSDSVMLTITNRKDGFIEAGNRILTPKETRQVRLSNIVQLERLKALERSGILTILEEITDEMLDKLHGVLVYENSTLLLVESIEEMNELVGVKSKQRVLLYSDSTEKMVEYIYIDEEYKPLQVVGPEGPQGDKGEKGDRGNKGDKGDRGPAFVYNDFTPSQLESLKGDKGNTGPRGEGIQISGYANSEEALPHDAPQGSIWLVQSSMYFRSDGNWEHIGEMKGPQGEKGDKGDKGNKGDTGNTGIKGNDGAKGDKGEPFRYSDFTQSQLNTLKGPPGATGARGLQGDRGPQGPQGLRGPKGDGGADVGAMNRANEAYSEAQRALTLANNLLARMTKAENDIKNTPIVKVSEKSPGSTNGRETIWLKEDPI